MTGSPEALKMLFLGLTAGVLSGMFGIGGGLVIVPALVVFFGFPIKSAVGTSLFAILLPTGLLGVLEYWKNGDLRPAAGLWIAAGIFCGAYLGALAAGTISQVAMKRTYAVFLITVGIYFLVAPITDQPQPCRGGDQAHPLRSGRRRRGRSHRPLTARLVEDLVDRPDESVGVAQGELAPAPFLIGGLAGDAQHGPFIEAMLVEFVHVGDLHLEVHPDPDPGVGELLRMGFLGVEHQGELADPEDGQGIRCVLVLGVDLDDFGTDDLVIELQRPSYVLDVQEDARDTGRHSYPPSRRTETAFGRFHLMIEVRFREINPSIVF